MAPTAQANGEPVKPSKTHKRDKMPYQKPGAAIRISSPQIIELEPNTHRSVTIAFAAPKRGQLWLKPKAKTGIEVIAGNKNRFDLAIEEPEIELDVHAKEEGIYHLMFHAEIEDGGFTSSRVLGVQVIVGNPQPVAQKPHPKIIKMQAEETIH